MKSLAVLLLAGTLVAGSQLGSTAAQTTDTNPPQQGAKQDIKDAGHSTANAAKKTGSAVKKTTKKGVHKTAHATKKGAAKVEDKTDSNPK